MCNSVHAFGSFPEMEEMEDGLSDLFDHIEDLLDFPGDEDVLEMVEPRGDHSGRHSISSPGSFADHLLGGSDGKDSFEGFAVENKKSGDDKFSTEEDKQNPSDELDMLQLEWMSEFLEDSDSFSLGLPCSGGAVNKSTNSGDGDGHGHGQAKVNELCSFFTSSRVLEADTNTGGCGGRSDSSSFSSSSSNSVSYFIGSNKDTRASSLPLSPPAPLTALIVPARARSKRTRCVAFSPRPHVVLPCYSPSPLAVAVPDPVSTSGATSDPESFGESFPAPPPLNKKQNKKSTVPVGDETDSPPPVRKCTHCEILKTPQWRAGPLGPKTLCNACGVRYKSGRLFPEYRPAASPTYVPSIHSNSHKKVVEMRIKATQRAAASGLPVSSSDGCDLLACIRRRE